MGEALECENETCATLIFGPYITAKRYASSYDYPAITHGFVVCSWPCLAAVADHFAELVEIEMGGKVGGTEPH